MQAYVFLFPAQNKRSINLYSHHALSFFFVNSLFVFLFKVASKMDSPEIQHVDTAVRTSYQILTSTDKDKMPFTFFLAFSYSDR